MKGAREWPISSQSPRPLHLFRNPRQVRIEDQHRLTPFEHGLELAILPASDKLVLTPPRTNPLAVIERARRIIPPPPAPFAINPPSTHVFAGDQRRPVTGQEQHHFGDLRDGIVRDRLLITHEIKAP